MSKKVLAAKMLAKAKTVKERGENFLTSIKRNLQKSVLDDLQDRIDALDDKIFELSDFSLATNKNQGVSAISRAEAEQRFKDIIEAEFDKGILQEEFDLKTTSFKKYFEDVEEEEAPIVEEAKN